MNHVGEHTSSHTEISITSVLQSMCKQLEYRNLPTTKGGECLAMFQTSILLVVIVGETIATRMPQYSRMCTPNSVPTLEIRPN